MVCFSMLRPSRRWNPNFQPGAVPWGRFYREFSRQQAHPFADHRRPFATRLEFLMGKPSRKAKTFSVVFAGQLQTTRSLGEAYQNMVRSTIHAHIDQALLHNAREF